MKEILYRCIFSFAVSAVCGNITNFLIEFVVRTVTGSKDFLPLSPEFVALFPSESIAVEVNILLYGIIGVAFSLAAIIYEKDRLGFIVQNILYFIVTSMVWVPIVTLVWQLHKYPQALIGTICGFVVTYIIMSIVGYRITKKNIEKINLCLAEQ
ncbi:MAG: DUF3021 domain-containing protein [Eubacterium sp.]|nr:DUF3021 domain-containing protein [Eubacterium sp.]